MVTARRALLRSGGALLTESLNPFANLIGAPARRTRRRIYGPWELSRRHARVDRRPRQADAEHDVGDFQENDLGRVLGVHGALRFERERALAPGGIAASGGLYWDPFPFCTPLSVAGQE